MKARYPAGIFIRENKNTENVYCEGTAGNASGSTQDLVVRCRTGTTYAQVLAAIATYYEQTVGNSRIKVSDIRVFGELVNPADSVHAALFDSDVKATFITQVNVMLCLLL